jgi:predicted porin
MLNVSASEDLGNGMSAFAKYNMLTTAGTSTGETNGDMVVGISGGFGTIVAGTMEDFTEGKLASMMSMEGTSANELSGNAGRTQGGLAYVSPTMNGLHFGIAGYAGTGAADTSNFDAVDVAVFYDNGDCMLVLLVMLLHMVLISLMQLILLYSMITFELSLQALYKYG